MSDGFIGLPPDGTGKKVDTSEIVDGANTVERQRMVLADPSDVSGLAGVGVVSPGGSAYGLSVRNVPYGPAMPAPSRDPAPGQVMFVEDFANGITGMFNDGCGSASVDNNVTFNGNPTVRLDPQGNSSTSSATGGTQQLTLSGSAATYTTGGSGTLIGTTTQTGTPTVMSTGYLVLTSQSTAAGQCCTDGNTYVLTYSAAAVTGSAGAWTVTFTGVQVLNIPGTFSTSCTTQSIGTATFTVNNPNPNGTGSPLTSGVVFKRRIDDQFSGRFGWSLWLRPTSKSSATSFTSVVCVSLYNRDGTSAWLSRVLIQTAVGMTPAGGVWSNDNQILWYVTGTSTSGFVWVPFAILTTCAFNQHSWDPVSGSWDTAGGWHYVKIITDFVNKKYVSIQFNGEVYTSMAGQPVYQIVSDSGAKLMHFSVEHAMAQSATRRFWNVARCVGTIE